MTAMLKPAQASGTVPPSSATLFGGGPNVDCYGMTSSGEVQSCTLNYFTQQFNQSLNSLKSSLLIANWSLSCPSPTLAGLGNIYQGQRALGGPFVDAFSITYYVIGYYSLVAYCGAPNVATYGIFSWQSPLACPANSTGTPITNPTSCTCNSPSAANPVNYVPDTARKQCVPDAACPDHAYRMSPDMPCMCNTDYQFDAAGTSCVRKCPVTKLDDITDPVAQKYDDGTYSSTNPDIEHLTPETQAGLACIKQKAVAMNCSRTPQATSGYRPAAYQTHLYNVYRKWQKIMNNDTPECAEVKASIKKEFEDHSPFDHAPGETSNHSRTDAQGNPAGIAVDIAFVPELSADAIACQCNMSRTVPNDSVHYQPQTCPR